MNDLTTDLLEQLDFHWQHFARPRLDVLTDEEYLWEPAPGTWNLRRREEAAPDTADDRVGAGDWVLDDYDPGHAEPSPPPVTSIAWRLAHLIVPVLGVRAHSHFGGPPCDEKTWRFAGAAQEALDQLDAAYAAWTSGVRQLDDEGLRRPVGPAEGPWADSPMLTLVLHINRETIHHLAEVALLRDLWAHGVR